MALPARRLAADLDEFVQRAAGLLGAVEHFRSEADVERATRALIEADAAVRADASEGVSVHALDSTCNEK
jgi:hypothetical protein